MIVTGYSENCWVLGGTGGYGGGLLDCTSDTGGTAGYWGVLDTRRCKGYCRVLLGTVRYLWVL